MTSWYYKAQNTKYTFKYNGSSAYSSHIYCGNVLDSSMFKPKTLVQETVRLPTSVLPSLNVPIVNFF
jgi:hypothetical protein